MYQLNRAIGRIVMLNTTKHLGSAKDDNWVADFLSLPDELME